MHTIHNHVICQENCLLSMVLKINIKTCTYKNSIILVLIKKHIINKDRLSGKYLFYS